MDNGCIHVYTRSYAQIMGAHIYMYIYILICICNYKTHIHTEILKSFYEMSDVLNYHGIFAVYLYIKSF